MIHGVKLWTRHRWPSRASLDSSEISKDGSRAPGEQNVCSVEVYFGEELQTWRRMEFFGVHKTAIHKTKAYALSFHFVFECSSLQGIYYNLCPTHF